MPKAAKKKQTENEPTEKDHVRLDYRPDKIIIGTDEAGRGPVLGPLVMAALAFKESDIQRLEWLGVKDSKMLSSEVRENLFERIREIVHDFRIEVIEPDAIDLSLEDAIGNTPCMARSLIVPQTANLPISPPGKKIGVTT